MSSLGESPLIINSWMAGEFRVLNVFAAPAIYPRLGIELECRLGEKEDPKEYALLDYELMDLMGEVRLKENESSIGLVIWLERLYPIRSGRKPPEHRLRMYCDLDPWRLERIEEHREGQKLQLWLRLWPIFRGEGNFSNVDIRPIQLEIPHETWLNVLEGLEYGHYEILEIPRKQLENVKFEAAINHIREARHEIDQGDYDGALLSCRKSIEALGDSLPGNQTIKGEDKIQSVLEKTTDERRKKEYYRIARAIKELAAMVAHDYGSKADFSRVETLFIVRTTENLLSLISSLA